MPTFLRVMLASHTLCNVCMSEIEISASTWLSFYTLHTCLALDAKTVLHDIKKIKIYQEILREGEKKERKKEKERERERKKEIDR